jgi:lipopolysaccharide export system permease protein
LIIFRYLSREVLVTMLAVSSILLLIIMTGRFVRYLADAAAGEIAVEVLFSIMGYRMPGFLELIIPLGFFIAILLAYGRLFVDSEMVVLSACGMSRNQLVVYTMIPALLVAGIVAALTFWISPLGIRQAETLLAQQRTRSEFDTILAGRFQQLGQGQTMAYVESVSHNNQRLNQLFVAQMDAGEQAERVAVIVAEYGEQAVHPLYGQRYLNLHNGRRYEGVPGSSDYQITEFVTYGQYMVPPNIAAGLRNKADAKTTRQLWREDALDSRVALQWRFSLPLLVMVVALMAVPLSHTNPRQGRYMKMLPAILLYMFYLVLLSTLRGAAESGRWPLNPGLWVIHPPFILIAVLMLNWHNIQLWRNRRRHERLLRQGNGGGAHA